MFNDTLCHIALIIKLLSSLDYFSIEKQNLQCYAMKTALSNSREDYDIEEILIEDVISYKSDYFT